MISLMVFDENKGFEVESMLRVAFVTKTNMKSDPRRTKSKFEMKSSRPRLVFSHYEKSNLFNRKRMRGGKRKSPDEENMSEVAKTVREVKRK